MKAFALLLVLAVCVAARRDALLWLCLELCNQDGKTIDKQIADIKNHPEGLTIVSYELFGLENAQFINISSAYNLTDVSALLPSTVHHAPMIVSPDIDQMRALFASPGAFIDAAVQTAVTEGYYGYNIDFEPTNATTDDVAPYCEFLTAFADAMHQSGKWLSVDVATWSPMWNYTQLAQTTVDKVITMETYTGNFTFFSQELALAKKSIPGDKLGIGLDDHHKYAKYETEVAQWLGAIEASGSTMVGIWDAPLPDNARWWHHLAEFIDG